MIIPSVAKAFVQQLTARAAGDRVVDEAEARAIVDQLKQADPSPLEQNRLLSSLWHTMHPRDYYLPVDGATRLVRVLPVAEPDDAACKVLNAFAASLPALPGVEPDFAKPQRFGDRTRNLLSDGPAELEVRRDLDGSARAPTTATSDVYRAHDLRAGAHLPTSTAAPANTAPASAPTTATSDAPPRPSSLRDAVVAAAKSDVPPGTVHYSLVDLQGLAFDGAALVLQQRGRCVSLQLSDPQGRHDARLRAALSDLAHALASLGLSLVGLTVNGKS